MRSFVLLQTSTPVLRTALSAKITAVSPCAGSVMETMTVARMKMSPTVPAQVLRDLMNTVQFHIQFHIKLLYLLFSAKFCLIYRNQKYCWLNSCVSLSLPSTHMSSQSVPMFQWPLYPRLLDMWSGWWLWRPLWWTSILWYLQMWPCLFPFFKYRWKKNLPKNGNSCGIQIDFQRLLQNVGSQTTLAPLTSTL